MKKGIIITILILSIIMCNKVKALNLDGTLTEQVKVRSSELNRTFYKTSGYDNTEYDWSFATEVDPTGANYLVFTIQNLVYTVDHNSISEHYGTGFTGSYYDTYNIYNTFVREAQPRFILEGYTKSIACELQNNKIVCPLMQDDTYIELNIKVKVPESDSNTNTNWEMTIYNYAEKWATDTQAIINNQNQNTQQQIESQMVCEHIDKEDIAETGGYLNEYGNKINGSTYGITNYKNIINAKIQMTYTLNNTASTCFYNTNKTLISCIKNNELTTNEYLTIPNEAKYVRFSIQITSNRPQFEICQNGNQAMINSDHNYNTNATEDYGNQTDEMQNITNAEDTLMQNLDFNTTEMNITINPNASTFIWNVVDSLRSISTKIVLLMTSLLSIGIIKLVLNR